MGKCNINNDGKNVEKNDREWELWFYISFVSTDQSSSR